MGFMDMFNGCGPAFSQGDGSDFHTGCNWEAAPSSYSTYVRAWSKKGTMQLWGSLCHAA